MQYPLRLIVDAHQDLAWNMLTFGRDYTRSAAETRALERGTDAPRLNGDTLLGWEDYQQGRVALVFATLFNAPMRKQAGEWDTQCYLNAEQAYGLHQQQLDAYHRLVGEHPDKFRLIRTQTDLSAHLAEWDSQSASPEMDSEDPEAQTGLPVGLVILMENAEGIRHVDELTEWWSGGVRMIGPAWAGTRFCGGTAEPGPLTNEGYALLEAMSDLGFVLDISHMDAYAAMQALDSFEGTVIASHANPLALMHREESNRFLPDELIAAVFERGGVIGAVPYNRFLDSNWVKGMRRELVSLVKAAAVIDYYCQMAGDARHVGLGSDFDGGFGWQHIPHELNTIADLHLLAPLLAQKGYRDDDLDAIFGKNWLTMLQSALPERV
ncbi:MAG: membrane dipeptidase [Anaerolineales bacterium]|nr:membrane dipeptidase [Anaerolineales bacterium]